MAIDAPDRSDVIERAMFAAGLKPPHVGALVSDVPGRTDAIKTHVKPESFVIPADVVSHFGEGNTLAGMKVLNQTFGLGDAPAKKGDTGMPVAVAGGEMVIPPEIVAKVGGGDMKRGHDTLREFVLHARAEHIKTLKKLKPPHR